MWDDQDFFLKPNYNKYYEEMKKVGIIFSDKNKAKIFLDNLNLDEIYKWWDQPQIQKIKNEFVFNYVNTKNFNYKNLKNLFLSL